MDSSKKQNQREKVLEYIRKYGGITQLEAMAHLGVGRLSGRVYELRKMGFPIETTTICVKNSDGTACYPARYVFGDGSDG